MWCYLFVALKPPPTPPHPANNGGIQTVAVLQCSQKAAKVHTLKWGKMTAEEVAVPGVLQICSMHCRFNDNKIIHIYERKWMGKAESVWFKAILLSVIWGGESVLILKQYSCYRCFQTPSLIQGNKIPFSNKPRFRDGACSNINIS